jgi:methionyl-tRNA formyltransferase
VLESEQKLQQYLEAREVQDEQFTVYAHKLTKAEAQIDWRKSVIEIDRTIRAFNPWPVAFTPIDESNNLRIWNATISDVIANGEDVGTIIEMDKQGVHVVCGEGVVCLTSLQWPGGKALNPVQIIQGHKLSIGHQFA